MAIRLRSDLQPRFIAKKKKKCLYTFNRWKVIIIHDNEEKTREVCVVIRALLLIFACPELALSIDNMIQPMTEHQQRVIQEARNLNN